MCSKQKRRFKFECFWFDENNEINEKCRWECKNPEEHNACKKDCICNPAGSSFGNCEYLASTIDNSVVTCEEIINAANTVSTNVSANGTCTVPINATNAASINFWW